MMFTTSGIGVLVDLLFIRPVSLTAVNMTRTLPTGTPAAAYRPSLIAASTIGALLPGGGRNCMVPAAIGWPSTVTAPSSLADGYAGPLGGRAQPAAAARSSAASTRPAIRAGRRSLPSRGRVMGRL